MTRPRRRRRVKRPEIFTHLGMGRLGFSGIKDDIYPTKLGDSGGFVLTKPVKGFANLAILMRQVRWGYGFVVAVESMGRQRDSP
jgi:hypothetical protein